MLKETEQIIELLKNDYNIRSYVVTEVPEENADILKVDNENYVIHQGYSTNQIEEFASLINANYDGERVSETAEVEEKLSDIIKDKIYKYEPTYIDETETELSQIAALHPYCKVIDKLIVSKDEDEGLITVTFNVDKNKDIELPDFAKKDYIVFESDLKEFEENEGEPVAEGLDTGDFEGETSTALLTALNSEKEAVATYEFLINSSTDNEEIELLTKILDDEKEHIALLSALQTKKTVEFVDGEENNEDIKEMAESVVEEAEDNLPQEEVIEEEETIVE